MDLVLRPLDLGGVPVLSVGGEVDMATAPRLRDALVQLAAEHPGCVAVLDLDGVAFIDSVGLGVLVGGLRRMRTAGGDLTLVCSTPRLTEVLMLCRLDRVFEIHPNVAAASGAIHRGR
jgi:anti-sigma B factor antagonist